MYTFNRCYDHNQQNTEVYDTSCAEIVMGALNGINGTVFMYGQTGAGKTYTMLGDTDIKERASNLSRVQRCSADPQPQRASQRSARHNQPLFNAKRKGG